MVRSRIRPARCSRASRPAAQPSAQLWSELGSVDAPQAHGDAAVTDRVAVGHGLSRRRKDKQRRQQQEAEEEGAAGRAPCNDEAMHWRVCARCGRRVH